jgi:DNA polymerase III subunit beta
MKRGIYTCCSRHLSTGYPHLFAPMPLLFSTFPVNLLQQQIYIMLKTTLLLENLNTGISFALHGVSSRNPLPILLNFLIEAKDGEVVISSTDLEIGIQTKVPARVEKEGAVTVSAKTFTDIVSSISREKIELSEEGGVLVLTAKGTKTKLPTAPATDFPKLYEEKGQKRATIKKELFDKEVSKVVFSAATDSGRPALSGLLIERNDKEINLVATDGYRLSLKRNSAVKTTEKEEGRQLIIPARIIKEVVGSKNPGAELGIFISPSNNQALFEMGDNMVVGRLIEAEYPDYQRIIPQSFGTKAVFDRSMALNAVRSCSVIAREAANIVKMSIGKNSIFFSASASSAGENRVEIDAKTSGEENEIAFNSRYLLDFLSAQEEENISFEMTGPLNPGVFKIADDESYLHLIMPIRVAG